MQSFGVLKRSGREADHSPPSGAQYKNAWSDSSTPPYVFMAWTILFLLYLMTTVSSSHCSVGWWLRVNDEFIEKGATSCVAFLFRFY
jgi:hypothetical protein